MNAGRTLNERSTEALIASGHVRGGGSPFALPVGWKGRLAGWYMNRPDAQHRELAAIVPLETCTRLLEIGFGPGQMLQMIHDRAPAVELSGIDPSELMVQKARRRNPYAELRLGAAGAIPFPDDHADLVLSVNNVPMWPDLDAGIAEVRRILRPGGTVFLAWHGGHDPRGHQRRLVLSDERTATVDAALHRQFSEVSSQALQHSTVWKASEPAH